jgi:hypothetical protein
MDEARERVHNIECNALETMYGKVPLQLFEQSDAYKVKATMVAILAESLQAFETVEQLRALLQPKPDVTIFDFDLSSTDWKAKQKAELQLFHLLKANNDVQSNEIYKKLATEIIKRKIFDKFIKSEEDRKLLIDYAVQSALKYCNPTMGISLFGFYISHSCDPNVGKTFVDNKTAFIVLKPIKKGEQLFANYNDEK